MLRERIIDNGEVGDLAKELFDCNMPRVKSNGFTDADCYINNDRTSTFDFKVRTILFKSFGIRTIRFGTVYIKNEVYWQKKIQILLAKKGNLFTTSSLQLADSGFRGKVLVYNLDELKEEHDLLVSILRLLVPEYKKITENILRKETLKTDKEKTEAVKKLSKLLDILNERN